MREIRTIEHSFCVIKFKLAKNNKLHSNEIPRQFTVSNWGDQTYAQRLHQCDKQTQLSASKSFHLPSESNAILHQKLFFFFSIANKKYERQIPNKPLITI